MIALRPPPFFIGDHPGLDFLNTVAVPVDVEVEWLTSGHDLLAWLNQAELVPEEILGDFRANAVPGELDRIAAQARALRDWFKPFVYHHMGRQLDAAALSELTPLNQLLARDAEFGQIAVRDHASRERQVSGLAWRKQRRWRSPEMLLLPVARSLADLVCSENLADVKACEGASCTLLFLDRTRGRVRRWCRMAVCGNRAKQATHRNRTKQMHSRREADL